MVYFVSCKDAYTYPVYPEFLDISGDEAWKGIPYEADPDTLDLRASEREALADGWGAIEHGYRVVGDKAPKKMLWEGGELELPEVIMCNCLAVSPRFRDLVEQFEPGVHQFFPVEIYKTRDGDPVATYYWINVCNRIDSIDENKTTYLRKIGYDGSKFWSRNGAKPDAKIVFSREKMASYHLWFDPDVPQSGSYCSNAFAKVALESDFSGLSLTEREEA